ncbi:MAG: DUF883 family protein [Planctomycetes bacterium]|nr:DUF883 family protein [Planctomycetota bacterium]
MTTLEHTRKPQDEPDARHELREQAGRVKDDVGELARVARRAVREEFARLGHAASEGATSVGERAAKVRDGLEERVAERPKASLALAAGAGLLFGFLFARRR